MFSYTTLLLLAPCYHAKSTTWIQAYDIDGTYSGVMPERVPISNVDIEDCSKVESLYLPPEKMNVQLLKNVIHPLISINHCRLRSTLEAEHCGKTLQ